MRRLIGSGAGGLAVVIAIAVVMPGARAATVNARPVTSDRGLQMQMQRLLAWANPLVNPRRTIPSHATPGSPRGAPPALAPGAPLVCFVAVGSCPLTPCVVPVTAGQLTHPAASGGSCPAGAARTQPHVHRFVVNSSATPIVMPSATRLLDPSGHRLSASP